MAMYEWCKVTRSPLQRCIYSNVPQPSLLPKISLHRNSIRPNARNTMVILGTPHYWKGRCKCSKLKTNNLICLAYRWDDEEIAADNKGISFEVGVFLFNSREYYRCHDVFERLWNHAEEPQRTLLHGILQCCVGFYHLFNQNHHGAMVELGEGLNKLHKLKSSGGPFHQFEQDISTVLEFIYHTQMEHAACTDDYCLTMDGSARSYQLLGNFGAGQPLYEIRRDSENGLYIYFNPRSPPNSDSPLRVKVPVLQATEEDLKDSAKH